MEFKHPFSTVDREQRLDFGIISGVSGLAGIAIATYVLSQNHSPRGFVVAGISTAVGLFALVISRRLLTNRTPHKAGHLVSPWITAGVGVLFVFVGAANMVTGEDGAAWLLPPGIAAIVFAWQQIRRRPTSPSDGDGA